MVEAIEEGGDDSGSGIRRRNMPKTDTERELFDAAVNAALDAPEIAKAIEDYFSADDVEAHIQAQQASIWESVATARARLKEAEEALQRAEDAVYTSLLDPDEEATWEQRRDEVYAGYEAVEENAEKARIKAQEPKIDRSLRTAKALYSEIAETDSGQAPTYGAQQKPGRRSRSRNSPEADDDRAEYEYQRALERLRTAKRARDEFEAASARRQEVKRSAAAQASRHDAACQAAREAVTVAAGSLGTDLIVNGTMPVASSFVNERASHLYETDMRVPESSGLYDSVIQSSPFVTSAMKKVDQLLQRMKSASFGIGGPRGAGKSTLIEYFCGRAVQKDEGWMRIMVSAPVEYVPREFILYLIAELCQGILGVRTGQLARPEPQPDRRIRIPSRRWVIITSGVVVLLAILPLTALAAAGNATLVPTALTVAAASLIFLSFFFERIIQPPGQLESLRRLRRIIYLLVVTIAAVSATQAFIESWHTILTRPINALPLAVAFVAPLLGVLAFIIWAPYREIQVIEDEEYRGRYREDDEYREDDGYRVRYRERRLTGLYYVVIVLPALITVLIGGIFISSWRTAYGQAGIVFLLALLVSSLILNLYLTWNTERALTDRSSRRKFMPWLAKNVMQAPSLAAIAAMIVVVALWWRPTRGSLFFYGCMAIGLGAAFSFAAREALHRVAIDPYRRRPRESEATRSYPGSQRNDDMSEVVDTYGLRHWASRPDVPPTGRLRRELALRAPGAAILLAGLRNVLAFAGIAMLGLAYYNGELDYFIILAAGLLCIGAAIVSWVMRSTELQAPDVRDSETYRMPSPENQEQASAVLARQFFRDIEFLQTVSDDRTQTWKAGVSQVPVSFEMANRSGNSWARQPWSVPAAVERLKILAASAARDFGKVIIGIDELDKLEYDKAARFLNDIKAIFGERGSYFLVAVSENAAAGFERRGVPFRDVFDSSFDDVVTVGYLNWNTSRALLNTRVVGMHAPFAALCYVFSGGLARDLIRTSRTIFSYGEPGGTVILADAVRALCDDEMQGKIRGINRELANMRDDALAMDLLAHIRATDESFSSADAYLQWSGRALKWATDPQTEQRAAAEGKGLRSLRYARELAAFGRFTATVYEFFDEKLNRPRFTTLIDEKSGPKSIEHLAMARQAMAVSPVLAERYINEFRSAWKLGPAEAVLEN